MYHKYDNTYLYTSAIYINLMGAHLGNCNLYKATLKQVCPRARSLIRECQIGSVSKVAAVVRSSPAQTTASKEFCPCTGVTRETICRSTLQASKSFTKLSVTCWFSLVASTVPSATLESAAFGDTPLPLTKSPIVPDGAAHPAFGVQRRWVPGFDMGLEVGSGRLLSQVMYYVYVYMYLSTYLCIYRYTHTYPCLWAFPLIRTRFLAVCNKILRKAQGSTKPQDSI